MKYNFDKIIDRENTNSVKYDLRKIVFHNEVAIPMWVADMDFETPDFILDSIFKRCENPCFGYSLLPKEFKSSLINWQKKLHDWDIDEKHCGYVQGIVPSLSFIVQIFSESDDEVIIQEPVYHKFKDAVVKNNRKLIVNPLKEVDGKFVMDFEDFEKKISKKTKLLLLCNPHNPGAKVWSEDTLKKLSDICYKNNIIVISDEIHADMTFLPNKHIPFAKVSDEAKYNSITLTAPTKTFNMPALQTAAYIIPNDNLRKQFESFLDRNEIYNGNIFGQLASIAAYTHGYDYLSELLSYLKGNIDFVLDYIEKNTPEIVPMKPEASFLIWLNCEKMGLSDADLMDFMLNKVGIALNAGTIFGKFGDNHLRMNIACPRSILIRVLDKLSEELHKK